MQYFTCSYRRLVFLWVSLLLTGNGWSENFSNQAVQASTLWLNQRAKELADTLEASNYRVSVEPPPRRIKIPHCPGELHIQLLTKLAPGRQAIKAICREHDNQSLLVHAYISLFLPVLVSTHRIHKGSLISENNSSWQSKDISHLNQGYFRDIRQLHGLPATQTIPANQVLTPNMFQSGTMSTGTD